LVRADGGVKMSLSTGNVFGFVDSQLGKPRGTTAFARAPTGLLLAGTTSTPSGSSGGDGGSGGGSSGGGGSGGSGAGEYPAAVQVVAISMASLERMSADYPGIAVKLMKVLLRQSSLELSNS
jgi:hypothetical protein